MCIVLDVMCPKTKTKSKSSSSSSSSSSNSNNKKSSSSKSQKCHECTTRKVAREEVNYMFSPVPSNPMMPMMYPSPIQNLSEQRYVYGYEDWNTWEDSNNYYYNNSNSYSYNYPAVTSARQWRDHTGMANNAYNQSQDTSAKISEAKNAITGEIREAQRAIKDVHIDVVNTESRVRETRGAVDMARESIRSTHAAIKNTQDTIHDNHIELMEKQKECAAEVARVRKLLEEEARQREETRRLKEVVRYAQTQGLLQTSSGRTQSTRDRDRDRSSRSSSPETSSSSPGTRSAGRRSRANGEQDAQKRRQAEREKMKLELELEQSQQQQYADAMRGIAEMRQRQRLQNEHERWSRADWELDWRRRKELHFQGVRPQGGYYDDAVDAPASDTDSFVAHAGGHNNSHSKDRDGRIPHRGAPRCRQWDH